MIYILETELRGSKSIYFSLNKIYGLSYNQIKTVCKKVGFSINLKTNNLTSDQIVKLIKVIENSHFKINDDLKNFQVFNLKKLVGIKCYSGLRRIRGLPVRGQRTHTNAKTSRYNNRLIVYNYEIKLQF